MFLKILLLFLPLLLFGCSEKKQADQATKNTTNTESVSTGRYLDYSPQQLASTRGTKLLFFHAPWCIQCQELDMDIGALGVPSGVTIFKVDYDSNKELRKKYGVTMQTTIVRVDNKGNLLDSYNAQATPNLQSISDNLLSG